MALRKSRLIIEVVLILPLTRFISLYILIDDTPIYGVLFLLWIYSLFNGYNFHNRFYFSITSVLRISIPLTSIRTVGKLTLYVCNKLSFNGSEFISVMMVVIPGAFMCVVNIWTVAPIRLQTLSKKRGECLHPFSV